MRVPLPLTLFAGLALAACAGGATPTATSTPTSPVGATSTPAATAGATATSSTGGGSGGADQISCNDGVVGSDVSIVDFEFQPAQQTADADETVHWQNNGTRTHTITFDNGKDCGSLEAGDSLTVLFLAPGTYTYHCAIHQSMKGTITVGG